MTLQAGETAMMRLDPVRARPHGGHRDHPRRRHRWLALGRAVRRSEPGCTDARRGASPSERSSWRSSSARLPLLHLTEAGCGRCSLSWSAGLPDFESAMSTSRSRATPTVGYGDVVLLEPWRLLGPIEAARGGADAGLVHGRPRGGDRSDLRAALPVTEKVGRDGPTGHG